MTNTHHAPASKLMMTAAPAKSFRMDAVPVESHWTSSSQSRRRENDDNLLKVMRTVAHFVAALQA